jgi:hypothetical protein
VEIQHELVKNTTVEVRYVGTKGTKLWGGINLNEVDIFKNGMLTAFNPNAPRTGRAAIRPDAEGNQSR